MSLKKKKICIVTGTRAEYGLFQPLMRKLKASPKYDLQIVATGMHLSQEFGLTYREIEKDGFRIDEKVEMLMSSDSEVGIAKSTGLGTMGIAEALNRLGPDLVFLLGDRFEALAAATAAMISRIPIAHIHGGEITEGAIDESIRHAITKMSHLHFTSTAVYRNRVIQLGEDPSKVFNVGALGIDNIRSMKLPGRASLEKILGMKLMKKNLLITFHPVTTLEGREILLQMDSLLRALGDLRGTGLIFTMPNADTHGSALIRMVRDFVVANPSKAVAHKSLGQRNYLGALKYVDAVVGNSSSGIIEAPSMGKPTVNIGSRQQGRVRAVSVIDCKKDVVSISKALNKALSPSFGRSCMVVENPYGDGRASGKIMQILSEIDLKKIPIAKKFYDININV